MRLLREGLDLDGFFGSVRGAEKPALMLDYDGTLAPFVVDRDRAFPYPGVRERVDAILASGRTRLVVVSGRAASDIPLLLGTNMLPEIWGSHGWERMMPGGETLGAKLGMAEAIALERARAWAMELGHPDRLEEKPSGAAFHLRGLGPSEADQLRIVALGFLNGLARDTGFEIHEFDGGIEMRLAGQDKGDAVRTLLSEMPLNTPAAYLGDDLTDEDAFTALPPHCLGVLVRPELRETGAGLWIAPPDELFQFLDMWIEATGKGE